MGQVPLSQLEIGTRRAQLRCEAAPAQYLNSTGDAIEEAHLRHQVIESDSHIA